MPQTPIFGGFELVNAYGPLLFSNPVSIASPLGETNRLFIAERAGRVAVITNLALPNRSTYLDITHETDMHAIESGLLGLAFHPGFATNRYFFVFRTAWVTNVGFQNVVSRFRQSATDPDIAETNSETVILSVPDPSEEHNAGDIHFGPDGYLYVPMGDVGGHIDQLENKQPIDESLLGGILRIDVDNRPGSVAPNPLAGATLNYRVPSDNPFVGIRKYQGREINADKIRTEFFAVGFRNPWRITFDPETGDLLAGDVGGMFLEEINVVKKGKNYGWPYYEGDLDLNPVPEWVPSDFPFNSPLITYEHGTGVDQGFAVIGGIFYQGDGIAQLRGNYLFGDNLSGNIWAVEYPTETAFPFRRLIGETGISAFGRDPANNEVLVVNHETGSLKRLVFHPQEDANVPLTLADTGVFTDLLTLAPNKGVVPYNVNLSFWSDNAEKSRLFCIPEVNGRMGFDAEGNWSFPPGTVWVKHFEMELTNGIPESRRRLETRLIVKNADQVYGVTYKWDASQTNANLVADSGETEVLTIHNGNEVREQQWPYPSRAECVRCHTRQAGFALGFSTPQLNRDVQYGNQKANQIIALSQAGYLQNPVTNATFLRVLARADDEDFPLEHRVRSYLAANCSYCHQAESWSTLGAFWDGRLATGLGATQLIPTYVSPGSPELSRLFQRISRENELMPPIATSLLHTNAIELLSRWISALPPSPWLRQDIGAPHLEGSALSAQNGFDVSGAGEGFRSGRDEFHYLYQRVTGSVQVIARLMQSQPEYPPATAGIMLRASITPGSPYAMAVQTPHGTAGFLWRLVQEEPGLLANGRPRAPGGWFKLVREGRTAMAFESADGVNWTLLGSDETTWADESFVGFAVSSSEPSKYTTARFRDPSIIAAELTSPASGTTHPLAGGLLLTASVSSGANLVKKVSFYSGTNFIGESLSAPYEFLWTNGLSGDHKISARVHDSSGNSFATAPATVRLLPPTARGLYVGSDSGIRGNWKGHFGGEGYALAGDAIHFASSVQVSFGRALPLSWTEATSDERALLRSEDAGRVAGAWSTRSPLTLEVHLLDGKLHRVSLYFLDWDSRGRVQSVTVQDPASGRKLDVQTISNFTGGAYLTWTVRGDVRFIVSCAGPANPVVSGLFIDQSPHTPAAVSLVSPVSGSSFTAPTNIALKTQVIEGDSPVEKTEFIANGIKIGEERVQPFNTIWTAPQAEEYTVLVRVTDVFGEISESSPALISVRLPPASARFLGEDTFTGGNWSGAYGSEGFYLVDNAEQAPAYVRSQGPEGLKFAWAEGELESRALQRLDGVGRVASCWVDDNTVSFNLELLDGLPHVLSCYLLDWDSVTRRQMVRIHDAQQGTVLDARESGEFHSGVYLRWLVTGGVKLTIDRFSFSLNSVVSGFFFDPAEVPPKLMDLDADLSGAQPSVTLSWLAVPGLKYRVQYREKLTAGEWKDLPGTLWLQG